MAKSIRSKWRRKCRAVKRERYGKKELDRLKKTLGMDKDKDDKNNDISMSEITEIANVITPEEAQQKDEEIEKTEDKMDLDTIKKKYNVKTLRDENGCYPVWLHPRKFKKNKSKNKKGKKMHNNKKKSKKTN